MGVIYGIKNNVLNQIVYVGQTIHWPRRQLAHKSTAFNPNDPSYEFPLYRAIRKYGIENFSFEVLCECDNSELNSREIALIREYDTYYNGYNLTTGADHIGERTRQFSKEIIKQVVEEIKFTNQTFDEIGSKYGMSAGSVSLINLGKHSYTEDYDYPLRPSSYQLTTKDVLEIIDLLKSTDIKMEDIGLKFNVPVTVVSNINRGVRSKQPNIEYPIRHTHKIWTDKEFIEIIDLLKNTKLSMDKIAKKFNVSEKVISAINNGEYRRIKNWESFPIRNTRLSKDQVVEIRNLLLYSNLSINQIAEQFNRNYKTVSYINNGKTFHDNSYVYPLRSYR